MMQSMLWALVVLVVLIVGMVLALKLGRRWGCRESRDGAKGTGAVENAILGLLGLILAFSLFNAEERFDKRRDLIVEQVNALSAAYDNTVLLPEPRRSKVQTLLRMYSDEIRAATNDRDPIKLANPSRIHAAALLHEIWLQVTDACPDDNACAQQLLPSISEIRKIVTSRMMATRAHAPWAILILTGLLGAMGAALAGYSLGASRMDRPLHRLFYIIALIATMYLIIDVEFPQAGLVKIDNVRDMGFALLRERMM